MQVRWFTASDKAMVQLSLLPLFPRGVMASWRALLMVLTITSLLAGCSYVQPVKTEPSILPVADSAQMPSALSELMLKADQQYMQGQYPSALATLERAVRIKPRYPEIWSRMAQVYAQQGRAAQARQHAERSNSYIKSNDRLKTFNQQFIDE